MWRTAPEGKEWDEHRTQRRGRGVRQSAARRYRSLFAFCIPSSVTSKLAACSFVSSRRLTQRCESEMRTCVKFPWIASMFGSHFWPIHCFLFFPSLKERCTSSWTGVGGSPDSRPATCNGNAKKKLLKDDEWRWSTLLIWIETPLFRLENNNVSKKNRLKCKRRFRPFSRGLLETWWRFVVGLITHPMAGFWCEQREFERQEESPSRYVIGKE